MKGLKLIEDKKNISIMYDDSSLITINKKLLLISGLELKLEPKKKGDVKTRAMQLAKCYAEAKGKFYKTKAGQPVSEKSKNFKNFISAIDIIDRVSCTYKQYMEAQVEGLNFVDGGKGIFPKVNQLATEGAEDRILNFMRGKVSKDDENYLENTPPKKNDDYIDAWYEFLRGKATLKQMKYIRKCQLAYYDECEKRVKDEIKQLKKLKKKK